MHIHLRTIFLKTHILTLIKYVNIAYPILTKEQFFFLNKVGKTIKGLINQKKKKKIVSLGKCCC